MRLYHGTIETKGKQIIRDGMIRCNAPQNHADNFLCPDTEGYVYLTDKVDQAYRFGTIIRPCKYLETVYVFEADVPYELLEIDTDEIEIKKRWKDPNVELVVDAATSLKYLDATRIPINLIVGQHVKRYLTVEPSRTTIKECQSVKDNQWITLVEECAPAIA
ncbi:MAG: hypothetical protein RR178_09440 [Gordonibacter sp.]